jgi:hypothetical protein
MQFAALLGRDGRVYTGTMGMLGDPVSPFQLILWGRFTALFKIIADCADKSELSPFVYLVRRDPVLACHQRHRHPRWA